MGFEEKRAFWNCWGNGWGMSGAAARTGELKEKKERAYRKLERIGEL